MVTTSDTGSTASTKAAHREPAHRGAPSPSQRAARFAPLVLAALAWGACGQVPYHASSGVYASATEGETSLTVDDDGTVRVEATLLIVVGAYGEDQVALDAVSVAVNGIAATLDEVVIDQDDWPVDLDQNEEEQREIRVRAHLDTPFELPTGVCPVEVGVGVTVELLTRDGATAAPVYWIHQRAGEGERIDLARTFTDIDQGPRDPYSAALKPTIDEDGTVWVIDRDITSQTSLLLSRTAEGVVGSTPVGGIPTIAPAPGGGVFVVSPSTSRATVALHREPGSVAWIRELESDVFQEGQEVIVASHGERFMLAIPAYAALETSDIAPTTPTQGMVMLELDGEGAVVAVDVVAIDAVSTMALSADAVAVGTWTGEVVVLRGAVPAWRSPVTATAIAFVDDEVVAAGAGIVTRFDASGVTQWSTPLETYASQASIAVRADGEVLVGSSEGVAARVGPQGDVRHGGPVVCQGSVAFGGSGGRVAHAELFLGREGWGVDPDRELGTTILSFGEVLP